MARRKTLKLEYLVDECNRLLALCGPTQTPDFRRGIQHIVENALHDHGRYSGFRYLTNLEIPITDLPGVRYDVLSGDILPYPARFENTDSTRVQYGLRG